ncbi:ABC transporter ATP-binding protein [Rhodococcus sp. BP-252]|uniref:ABC transporter ATP-binding protein n=1 Tax=unclassified Rhodococcus (in: high G+C Gram-positive bacteria) TaxID=192944 RepID=UPI00142F85A4|nr:MULTISPECIES: ABC transporter ATP-binding protein [unclassified Rhodococcus (in: high G+C Gram-positive bacteria)]MBY6410731.1 ABC transporter ATP-binding protein [Rhodococcus sp. BP-320]MBY6415444.1 ABC transporter ATP-binding protein [Rhodococcus sp. BP-321]MBY6420059.1 ABC transporter ATP-binding protein [Rhodococcus sp. BP-324]MBY6425287.1 ABC transporter ATP-binding protein [Rhodococcus sp. BP-323]MBY6430650.1 ABC transporter ATP-binding protein [Rhodococcus sp. BP-322]
MAEQKATDDKDWRGVGNEDSDVDSTGNLILAGRSRRLLMSLMRPYRTQALLAIAIILVDNLVFVAGPLFIAYALDHGISSATDGNWVPLAWTVFGYIAFGILGSITTYTFLMVSGRLSQAILFDLRKRVFDHAQKLSLSFHEKYTSGRLISRLTSDVESLQTLLESALNDALTAILSIVSIAIILVYLDVPLGLIVLAGFVPLVWVTRWSQRRQRTGYRRTRVAIAKVVVHFVESMGGIRAVQVFRRQGRNNAILKAEDTEYRDATTAALRGMASYTGIVRWIGNVTLAIILVFGSYRVINGHMDIGILAAYVLYLRRFYGPLDELAMVFNAYQSAAAALEKISGVLEEQPSVQAPTNPVQLDEAAGKIDFDDVHFAYDAGRVVLPTFSLHVPAGQVVAMVGATGAGKSTLAKLLARFYDPTAGTVMLDGVDVRNLDEETLRRHVVMVTQESFLFSGTIADNIRLGKPSATDAEVAAAADAVGLTEFVDTLPDGLGTDVRKRGGRLSAGQRQLVAFARVFLAAPAVIVLDEATSSLDIPSERLVQRALETVLRDRTALIIAHRLSTVAIADRVLVMDGGVVVEDGPPADLIAGHGRFAELHDAWEHSLV